MEFYFDRFRFDYHYYFENRFTQCAKCHRKITSTDWIRRAKQYVFHLACFSCDSCDRQLSTGEEFALIQDQILCREHYLETIEGETTSSDGKFTNEKLNDLQSFQFGNIFLFQLVNSRQLFRWR